MNSPSHKQSTYFSHAQRGQTGFTLVEIMVGLAIGMLATVVIMQVFSVFEAQKRATTGAADAATNSNIGLFKIQRDLKQASYALTTMNPTYSPLNCPTTPATGLVIDPLIASAVTGISPISITDGGGLSDEILLRYGSTDRGGVPTLIQLPNISLRNTLGCVVGDISLVVNPASGCTLSKVTGIVDSVGGASAVNGTVTLNDTSNTVPPATLACLGKAWHEITYKVVNNTLQRQDTAVSPAFEPIVDDIVNIQAQYGVSALPSSADVVAWVDPVGKYAPGTITAADRNTIKSVRVAIVARDNKIETGPVTEPCNPVTNTGLCAWVGIAGSPAPMIDLSATADWKKYRYRVLELIIPLRNVIWSAPYL